MTFGDEAEVYGPQRYLAVISVLDYQDSASVEDLDFYSHASPSLQPEVETLVELGLVEENELGEYQPVEEYRDDFETIGEIVQVENNGKWEDIKVSELESTRTEVLGWIT